MLQQPAQKKAYEYETIFEQLQSLQFDVVMLEAGLNV